MSHDHVVHLHCFGTFSGDPLTVGDSRPVVDQMPKLDAKVDEVVPVPTNRSGKGGCLGIWPECFRHYAIDASNSLTPKQSAAINSKPVAMGKSMKTAETWRAGRLAERAAIHDVLERYGLVRITGGRRRPATPASLSN